MLTRRRFFALAALPGMTILTRSGRPSEAAELVTPLPIPPLLDAKANGGSLSLIVGQGVHAYRTGQPVPSAGYSRPVLGPAVRLTRSETATITVENKMTVATTVHWHGLVIPGAVDGGPHNTIAPGGRWTARLSIDQPEATAWFHPHPHGETAKQVYSGLAGILIVEDGSGERIGLPRRYGVDDLPLVLQDRVFDRNGEPVYRPSPMDVMAGFRGDTFIVNGVVAPVARVPAGLVRLRFVNGANARFFDLSFSDRRSFHVIASDGGYLSAPVATERLLIAPGERYEVLVDFSNGATTTLETGTDGNVPMMGMMGGAATGGRIMRFDVDPGLAVAVTDLPKKLVDVPPLDRSRIAGQRQFVLNDMMMGGGMMGGGMMGGRGGPVMAINGQPFDMRRVDVAARRGTVELWEIGSQMMGHPFHVHGTQFQIVSMNGREPPPHMRGWKDTVIVAREAQILVPLTQTASREHPFMFHCHILEHEDAGMMGQYTCS